ncbi:A24 family peptidase [Salinisphaera sp. LB1]|uniref:prepilin peptidase n=1 Tax=Salinisphaera sp. LB1 TaxID=2183911 RepID=UPI000D7074FB|nr:A24 family peptidase [Salinisphaera sp. LB1]AWN16552.1 Leader peptidase (Prepilin peptidase) [Salinisphaera sp. LB1]
MGPAGLPPAFVYIAVAVIGLVVGSFLNVVIRRLPTMMEAHWRRDAADILELPGPEPQPARFDLAVPRSHCPHCQTPIRARHNLPVVGYLMLRGRCAACGARISLQYPAIETAAALLAVLAVARFGATAWGGCMVAVSWTLLTLAAIDFRTQLLPDALTLPLLWAGLLVSVAQLAPTAPGPADAIVGAAAGYGVLWTVFQGFRLATGKIGMGHGDFKLAAALGAWLGWAQLPLALLAASLGGALVGGALIASGRLSRGSAMPFGPWLAFGGWLALVAGDTILHAYLTLSGLR